jgi:hypothetical protein
MLLLAVLPLAPQQHQQQEQRALRRPSHAPSHTHTLQPRWQHSSGPGSVGGGGDGCVLLLVVVVVVLKHLQKHQQVSGSGVGED